ncbi:CotS family spore coat protein [Clostridium isatidis]|uniref:Spore coat protein CotS n=1 Tax=Clostridium isatidis TaxID=182773 RepID=A0A343JDP6_9CLOT|nr:CotS family spore coat protein [Clostridium isatidis]ASW43654.1 spore coat protein CotS [Clostridium isatidis]NLZ34022.1 CotS family spore coat protein [Clostridiales bacterium]
MKNILTETKNGLLPLDEIKEQILPKYNLKNVSLTNIKFKDTEKQRAVYRVDLHEKSYCLKKVYYDEENLLYVYSALEWCFRNGINVPKLLPTADGNRYIKYKDMLFILTPWLDGEKCDFDNLNHMLVSSKTLGKLHKTSVNFYPIEGSFERETFEDLSISISKHFNQLLNSIDKAYFYKDRFSNLFLNNLDENLELAKISLEISSSINSSNLSRSLCHGDFVNKNILISDNEISLIDFDKCRLDYCTKDLSYFLRRLLKRETTNWQINLTLDILNSYMEENNLTEDDLKYIIAYIAFPQKFWKLSRDYYRNIKKCNRNAFILLLEKAIKRSENQLDFIYKLIKSFNKYYTTRI